MNAVRHTGSVRLVATFVVWGATAALLAAGLSASGSPAPPAASVAQLPAASVAQPPALASVPAGGLLPVGRPVARVAGATTSPARCSHPVANWWKVAGGRDASVEGFASSDSVTPGTPIGLYVSVATPRYRIEAYRMGFDGTGIGGCQAWRSGWKPRQRQPVATIAGPVHLVSAPWKRSLTVNTAGWIPGDYLLRIDGGSPASRAFVPITIRSPSFAGRVVLVMPDTTWQAYNAWGGYSLYHGPTGAYADRARTVSFDRPYGYGMGAADFVNDDLPLVALAERLGIPLGYATDLDLQRDPAAFLRARAIVSVGHDEYYSPTMRRTLTAARDAGVNLAFFGANDIFRKVRFAPSTNGTDRLMINYKDATDPIGIPSLVTTQWAQPPSNDPESSLVGASYRCERSTFYPIVVVDAGNWLFRGSGVRNGTSLPGIAGHEFDGIALGRPVPRPMEVLFHSPARCRGALAPQDTTYYTTDSGAGVLDAGAYFWVCGLDNSCRIRVDERTSAILTIVTENFLRAAAAGPLAHLHPAADNLRTFYPAAPPMT